MEADHITPWHQGGKTALDNGQMLCKEDNRRKGGRWWKLEFMDNNLIDELIKEWEEDFESVSEQEELDLDNSQSRKIVYQAKMNIE